jgi:phage/plasmid primase-like uncharacterized protein
VGGRQEREKAGEMTTGLPVCAARPRFVVDLLNVAFACGQTYVCNCVLACDGHHKGQHTRWVARSEFAPGTITAFIRVG